MDEITTTTIHYSKHNHWKLKKIALERNISIKILFKEIFDSYIEEQEDIKYYLMDFEYKKEETIEWSELKRSLRLDEIQDYGSYEPNKKNKDF
jgi:hypothetical protein